MDESHAQGGGRQYSEEDVDILLNETAKRAATEAVKASKSRGREREDDEEDIIGFSPKLVKQLQTTVGVFNTLKDFASNPLQKAIEERVGSLAAGVIEQAFSRPSGPPPKRDIIDTILNSQFAYGLGSGLGQRTPELVESMGRTFGQDKAEQMIDNVISSYGKHGGSGGQGGPRQLNQSPPNPPSEEKAERQQSEKEILLSLDPNNPEHVAAYAESQGGISVDVARKMLMIHQDEFIKQIKNQGADVSELSTKRGSHMDTHSNQPAQHKPIQHTEHTDSRQPEDIQYAEFQETQQQIQPSSSPSDQHANDQQNEMMRQFTEEIGKIMGDMVGKIEYLNNTVFTLQSELSEIKRGSIPVEAPSAIIEPTEESVIESMRTTEPIEIEPIKPVKTSPIKIRRSEEFFEEIPMDKSTFMEELDKETKKIEQETMPSTKHIELPKHTDEQTGTDKKYEDTEKEDKKDENIESKKFVNPIRKAHISTPSFGLTKNLNKDNEDKNTNEGISDENDTDETKHN